MFNNYLRFFIIYLLPLFSIYLWSIFSAGCNFSLVTVEPPGTPRARNSLDKTIHREKEQKDFLVGTGIYDITGPAAEVGMMGYAQISQKTSGILQRVYARAFIFAEHDNENKRLVFVSADLGQLFQSVQQGVLKRLASRFGDLYTEKNVMLSATHSHSGPGGYSHYLLYNLSTLGFNEQNYLAIVNGITEAIILAHNNIATSRIRLNTGEVLHASFNRSPDAYLLNPSKERALYSDNVDRTMTLLRIDGDKGPKAILNWFAVHGTSLNNKNLLISGDNKGYASSRFERILKEKQNSFIAAFAQEASGDISPNLTGTEGGDKLRGLAKLEDNGSRQLNKALELFNKDGVRLAGMLDYRQIFVNMAQIAVSSAFSDGDGKRYTCPSAIGISTLAGTADGRGVGKEGIKCKEIPPVLSKFLPFSCTTHIDPCHGNKPIVLMTGKVDSPLIPQILPIQLFRLDKLAIVGLPFEITTMAGRRIKKQIKESLKVSHVVIAGLSNAYAGYITTKEEYASQRYESASNQFGPYSLNAILQILDKLTSSMIENKEMTPGPIPPDLSSSQRTFQTPVIFDAIPFTAKLSGANFGSIKTDVKSHYMAQDTVVVEFWGAHPNNNLLTQDSFLFVEKLNDGVWDVTFVDHDFETTMEWSRVGLAGSKITIMWRIPAGTEGTFRIRHKGFSKSLWQENHQPYEGISSEFTVVK